MTLPRRPRCPQCGALLRRHRNPGELCAPCQQAGPRPRAKLPADVYTWTTVRGWLAAFDFGPFFLQVRELTGWTQQTLGGIVDLDQPTISAVERGDRRLCHITDVVAVANGLQIPPARLNMPDIRDTVDEHDTTGREKVSWVDRRDFGQHVAALLFSAAAAAGLDLDRLIALLGPADEPTNTRRIGLADIELIEQITADLRSQDHAYGSGLICNAAVAQVRTVLPLLKAEVPETLRPRLMLAAADLATQTGWMSLDVRRHETARRCWLVALNLTRHTEHPQATDLTVYTLGDMTLQSVYLGRPAEAQHLAKIGHTAAIGRYPVSASTTSLLRRIEAQAHAAAGDTAACDRALGEAITQLGHLDPASAPPWTAYVGEVGIYGGQGSALYTLGQPGRDARAAARAVPLLRKAIDHYGPRYARHRAVYLPELVGAHALAGDTDTAVTLGHQAIDAVVAVSSPINYDRLRTLHTVLEPAHTNPDVADLRERLSTVAA